MSNEPGSGSQEAGNIGKPAETPATPPASAMEAKHSPTPAIPAPAKKSRKTLFVVIALAILMGIVWLVVSSMGTVSTDDAYVNSHVTFVAPRVPGQVARVLVDDNNRVSKGQVLVELDKTPYQVQVDLKQAAVDSAKADVVAAVAQTRALVAQTRSLRFKLLHAIEDVHNQIAALRADVAALNKVKATLTLATTEYERAKKLIASKVTSTEEFDQRQEALSVAQAQVAQAEENVAQARVALGLPAKPENGDLTEVPADIDQTFSSVREAQAALIQSASQLNVTTSSFDLTPNQMLKEFYERDPQGNIDRIYEQIIKEAPAIRQAEAKLKTSEQDLEQAKLNLSYCNVVAEIDGVVTRRNVNPGNNVLVGQSLMAIRSLTEVWVDANFKETQLADLRIGLPVDLKTDVYGRKKIYKGRISGFTMGTGSTLALLPAQNATGNFVKVVQRLPVRIDIMDYNPENDPLFVGISVEPEVHIHAKPEGPNAGLFLQPLAPQPRQSGSSAAPANP